MPAPVVPGERVQLIDHYRAQAANSHRWSTRAEISMASSDSGVVSRMSGGSAASRRFTESAMSHATARPGGRATRPCGQPRLQVVQQRAQRAHVQHATGPASCPAAIRDSSGSMAASVFPPAVGAASSTSSPAQHRAESPSSCKRPQPCPARGC